MNPHPSLFGFLAEFFFAGCRGGGGEERVGARESLWHV